MIACHLTRNMMMQLKLFGGKYWKRKYTLIAFQTVNHYTLDIIIACHARTHHKQYPASCGLSIMIVMDMAVYLSVCLSVCLSDCLSVYLFVCLSHNI